MMEKYFDLVLDLLEIKESSNLKEIANQLIYENEKWNKVLYISRYWFLFDARMSLLNGEIMPEDFVQIWDYWSNFDIYCDWNVDIKKKLSDLALWKFSDDVFVIDRDWREFFLSNDNKKKIEQRINNNNKKILFLD